jgi:hypothetical protein
MQQIQLALSIVLAVAKSKPNLEGITELVRTHESKITGISPVDFFYEKTTAILLIIKKCYIIQNISQNILRGFIDPVTCMFESKQNLAKLRATSFASL